MSRWGHAGGFVMDADNRVNRRGMFHIELLKRNSGWNWFVKDELGTIIKSGHDATRDKAKSIAAMLRRKLLK